MRTIEKTIYKFEELSIKAQHKALAILEENQFDHAWYNNIIDFYKDECKEQGHIELIDVCFDLSRNSCNLELNYLIELSEVEKIKIYLKLKEIILKDLHNEYDFLTSRECLIEIANEFEFYANGEVYFG